jgi:hypothetical protein
MEMSIDKAIEHGKEQLDIFGGEHKEFIETAIETMFKYKKIENIVREVHEGCITKYQKIEEVLKDGDDN